MEYTIEKFKNNIGNRVVVSEKLVGFETPRMGVSKILETAKESPMIKIVNDDDFTKPMWVNLVEREMTVVEVLGDLRDVITITVTHGRDGSWYEDKVGESFRVHELPSGMWQVVNSPLCIRKTDFAVN